MSGPLFCNGKGLSKALFHEFFTESFCIFQIGESAYSDPEKTASAILIGGEMGIHISVG